MKEFWKQSTNSAGHDVQVITDEVKQLHHCKRRIGLELEATEGGRFPCGGQGRGFDGGGDKGGGRKGSSDR